ncbi:MAG: hypothetical protein ABJH45_15185 [Paracoccaceae bacterium]
MASIAFVSGPTTGWTLIEKADARHETSIAFNSSHLQSEIDVIKQSIGAREKR